MPSNGPSEDNMSRRWIDSISARHRLARFSPPRAQCSCEEWQDHAPEDMVMERARDFLLDGFLRHKAFMKKEHQRYLAITRAAKDAELNP